MMLKIRKTTSVIWSSLITGIFLIFGTALILQPSRWANTPSYANLLALLSSEMWGIIHLVVGIALGITFYTARHVKWFSIITHTAAIALVSAWFVAFIVRYLTDDGTTIVNVVSWGVYLALLIQSAVSLDSTVIVTSEKRPIRHLKEIDE